MKLSINKSRSLWWGISSIIILAGIISMVISWQQIGAPLRPSLDFVGGTRLQFERDCSNPDNCNQAIDINEVREVANAQGLGDSSIQIIADKDTGKDNGVLIRTKTLDVEQRTKLQNALSEKIGTFDPQKTQIDTVGPTIGKELLRSGLIALVVSFIGIIVYLTFRFQLDFAVFAIIALFHDVLVTVGIFSILGLVAGIEVDSLFIVALLTITGFSVNDTVVIYDRIRETLKINPNHPIAEIVDDAVNQTLTRSINTTLTTLLTLFAIFLFGGATLKNFSLALIIGFTMGAYSSIFIASTLLALWRERKAQPVVSSTSESINS
ncbi:protein translocase subunit SecF [Fischerella thermalis]|jgi:preprotein translocase subunit SecF|uniref:Protein-export membrane protein SecF n=1 Tax=Fischerella thermalis JSC-11 TaxID=741277 RepID=G6FY22_9CYAN|nr:protein translocase subunit SecF [Fischerella thermalis]PMB11658.1 protein translocase subunit SecF [Fischerella thermalis CCMEE 5328]RDH52018.1 protein translocase subunit SecF [Mastigocladus laminosus WC112]EHC10234.1 protein-export membrane protein SecF [Fischerella thermalis JSC-11]PLZ05566.1 protein translocase subunit SecF [Fischerella thermalis WC119]PLZ07209.1 protein translocase subunit SecF [Fischerella thermalis WC114]